MATLLAPQDNANMAQAQWQEMFGAIIGNGVVQGQLNSYVVTTTSGLGISVASGKATIQGFYARSDAAVPLTCAAADPTNPRIDRAILHADLTAHTLTVQLLTGTPAPSPSPPALTQTATVWEISLYQVRVNANQTTLTGGSLTDERAFSGLVNRGGDTMTGTLTVPELDYGAGVGGGFFSKFTYNAAASLTDIWAPQSGGSEQDMTFIIWAAGGPSISLMNLGNSNPANAPLNVANGGGFSKLGGQVAVGSFGAPVIVSQALASVQTVTGDHTVLSFTAPANGLYRIQGYAEAQHSGGPFAITAKLTYVDDTGTPTLWMVTQGAGNTTILMNGSTTFFTAASFSFQSLPFYAKSGTAANCHWNNPDSSPNDLVWFVIERLA